MYQYRFIKEEQYNQEHGVYTAYGICGYELAQNVMRETIVALQTSCEKFSHNLRKRNGA